jgi:hypothetical protein
MDPDVYLDELNKRSALKKRVNAIVSVVIVL